MSHPARFRYFTEFEFKSHFGCRYWLPLYIADATPQQAEDIATRIKTGLSEKYSVSHYSPPKVVLDGLNSERIAEYHRRRAVGRPTVLNVHSWKMTTVKGAADLSFDAQSEQEIASRIDAFAKSPNRSMTLATGEQHAFRVHIIDAERPQLDEFLLIDVVEPPATPAPPV